MSWTFVGVVVVGRPEKSLDPTAGSVQQFAAELREVRELAGRPTYRQLAAQTHYSSTVLSRAAAGKDLPSLAVTLAFVEACGGDSVACGLRTQFLNMTIPTSGGFTSTRVALAVSLTGNFSVSGDSGGPVFSLAPNNKVTAKGILLGVAEDSDGNLFEAFMTIDWVSSDFGVHVNT
jgi:hypothetical protein